MSSDEVMTKMCFNITIIIKEIVNQPAISIFFFIPIIHFANKAFSVGESKEVLGGCVLLPWVQPFQNPNSYLPI